MQRPSVGAILFGLIPCIAMCFSVPLWDHVYPFVCGLPFNMFWLCAWILITPLFMLGAYRCEKKAAQKGRDLNG